MGRTQLLDNDYLKYVIMRQQICNATENYYQ